MNWNIFFASIFICISRQSQILFIYYLFIYTFSLFRCFWRHFYAESFTIEECERLGKYCGNFLADLHCVKQTLAQSAKLGSRYRDEQIQTWLFY